jgi:Arc/MetJ-type ribon-helix-helix transcriptional regulator
MYIRDNVTVYDVKKMARKKREPTGSGQLSLRQELLGELSEEEFSLKKREISVMTRMNSEIVEILDALVELEIFKSRSEAVAAFVEQMISSRMGMFQEMKSQAQDISRQREAAKRLAFEAMKEDKG